MTNAKDSILLYRPITPFTVNGVQKDDPAITCTGKGYILWQAKTGESLLVPTYYCANADGTILSPQSIQDFYSHKFNGFHFFCDCDNKQGHLKFYNRNGIDHVIFEAYSSNNLWYHDIPSSSTDHDIVRPPNKNIIHPTVNKLNKTATHELWHQRLLHPGE